MAKSPYCARDTTGGTSAVPLAAVGDGAGGGEVVIVGEGAEALGVGLVLAGVVQAPSTSDARSASPFTDEMLAHRATPRASRRAFV